MAKIKILSESLTNQIAAGEVIERPASVVKELIENALDARARRIEVEVKGGGQQLIRVIDNGEGMDREDILLCLERHATSKIATDTDLFHINTMGFRGEALPSIASVSRMALISRRRGDISGHRVTIHYGRIKEVLETGCPEGTVVEVRDLFGNLPARRKFLKSYDTETGHIQDVVEHIALAACAVQFIFSNDGHGVFTTSSGEKLEDRLQAIFHLDHNSKLIPVSNARGEIALSGYIAVPEINRASLRSLCIFINGRFVRDRIIQHAVLEAYGSFLMKGRYPLGALYVTLPPAGVDVNVHPAKHEVRFKEPKLIHQIVSEGIRAAILSRQKAGGPGPAETHRSWETYREPVNDAPGRNNSACGVAIDQTPGLFSEEPLKAGVSVQEKAAPYAGSLPLTQPSSSDLRLIGQLAASYLLCQSEEGLIIIDQHAAHERILFENLKDRLRKGGIDSQQLLFPVTLELARSEREALSGHLADFAALGMEIAPFGGETFVIRAAPAILAHRDIKELVESALAIMATAGGAFLDERLLNDILALMACHAAIKAGQPLTVEEMESLLQQLNSCPVSSNCPHGRPIRQLYTYYELEKGFKRK
ncbi:MAG: DNA mismatch repair endonuclease MutL [Deltaproteobacteria bacterium]|nr:DNA mismatch repair endonuclease MutL [Deltaproteobacteria bacterium]